jgi:ribosomal protein S18 acetylase RimI-like enzyme
MATLVEIRPAETIDPDQLRAHVVDAWGGESVVAHGEALLPAELPGFVAIDGGRIAGHVSYRIDADACELTSIEADPPRRGMGTRLLDAVVAEAHQAGCRTVWLTTTNDNLDALAFYQRRGFRLRAFRPGAVDLARETLKPQIPEIGSHGIPMHDELDLELVL